MNVKLLRKVKKHILQEPRRFFMEKLVEKGKPGQAVSLDGIPRSLPACGTAACIAGWVCILEKTVQVDRRDAEEILGISDDEGERLFFVPSWPDRYRSKWRTTTDLRARAKIGANRIDHFIKTKGAE